MGIEIEFDSDSHYRFSAAAGGELDEEWTLFQHNLKTESRFFIRTAARILGKIFRNLERHRTNQGTSVIVDAGFDRSNKTLYRARGFQ